MYVLIITAPDGTETRNRPVMYGPQLVAAVSETLRVAGTGLTRRQRDGLGMQVMRAGLGTTCHEQVSGYRFRVEEADTAGLTLLSTIPAQTGA